MNPNLSFAAEARRHDQVIGALIGIEAVLLIGGSWSESGFVFGLAAALLGVAIAAGLIWRLPGTLSARLGLGLVAALMMAAIEFWAPRLLSERAIGAAMPVVLAMLLPYRDWRPLALAGVVHGLADLLKGQSALTDVLLLLALTGALCLLARRMELELAERFELQFLVNAMGSEGPIRLNLDVVRAESPMGQRLKQVQQRMAQALGLVREATMSVHQVSSELSGSAVELSERTRSTARGLEDAAMSLEQINVIVQESARASAEAKQLAYEASRMAAQGGEVVGRMVTSMQEINVSSRRITDIIGTIDAIAFQTNILALNAAVEAARAGEAGRGFAVVATEVRMLAGRSAEAAREIKGLIAASLETVDRGTREAETAGRTMSQLVGSVQGVGKAFESLTADSAEHAVSIDVVTASVKELDVVTTRNLDVAQRSNEIAAALLHEAVRLAEVLTSFRIGNDQQVETLLAEARQAAAAADTMVREVASGRQRSEETSGGVDFF
ncbi:methyl-accepting chemotaxis protein [Inhella sp.]|uniref:methyl-accepting chemotaxis protein n=1 Tax=Inhella sp. TaxID=1921806 RepID=UPI0035AE8B42